MLATRVACPRCQAVLSSQGPLPAGRLLKCGKCTGLFRVPQAGTRIVCPACRAAMRFPGIVPPNQPIRCAKCTTVFRLGSRASLLARATAKHAATPPAPRARPTQLSSQKPTTDLTCKDCGARMRISGVIRPGLAIPCPRCQKKLPLPATKKTMLAPAKPNKTTQLVPSKARPTKLATAATPSTKLASTKPPTSARFRCPACQAQLSFPGSIPAGRSIKCPKCARFFHFQSKEKLPPANGKLATPVAKPHPAAGRLPNSLKYGGTAIVLLVVAAAAFWLGKSLWSHDIPASEWVEFAPAGGRCRILMPGAPQTETVTGRTAPTRGFKVEREIESRGYSGVPVGSLMKAFILEFADHGNSVAFEQLWAANRDRLVRHFQGPLLRQHDLRLGPHRGKEFAIEPREEGTVLGRFYLVNSRTYLLLAVGAEIDNDAVTFFNSFRLEE